LTLFASGIAADYNLRKMRIILYTGKGGVGKTSVAAATALRCANMGYRTIVLSTDSAHSLADSFDIPISGGAQPIATNLWAQETEMSQTVEKNWERIQGWLAALMAWRGMEEIVADEMAIVPGMEELANLLYILYYEEQYDVVIVDCAPTGDTLRLLSFPEILRWWVEKMFPIGRAATGLVRPLVRPFLSLPLPGDDVFRATEDLFTELDRMHKLLSNKEKSSMRLVLNPEKMVIKEAQRTFTYLNLYGYLTDLIICNRVLPQELDGHYFDSWKEAQGRYYQVIEECFTPLPILSVPFFQQEVVGLPMLEAMGQALFADKDPTQFFFHGQSQEINREDNYYVLSLPLPFLTKEDVSVIRNGDELIIKAGRYKRNIILPRALIGLPIQGAKFEQDKLCIRFEREGKPSR
jgi:arsenite-transporting ATPase